MIEFTTANFEHAYEYLEWIELNNQQVDWDFVKSDTKLFTDLLLLRIIHNVVQENA